MKFKLLFPLVLFVFCSCDGTDGLFGHSKTKQEAKANGSTVVEYLPNKNVFNLLDGTEMRLDTAWSEISFTYKDNKRVLDSAYGFVLQIPVKNDSLENFTFNFGLLDKANQVFTNAGPGKEALCQLHPRFLYDTMRVILEQKNTDTSQGWKKPIIADTIIYIKIK